MAKKERWASRIGLVLAMAGNAVGLGNFLRFPAQAAQNGGGAFLIPYLVSLAILGLPLMWIEWTIGRYGGQSGHHSTPGLFQAMGRSPAWKYAGVLGLVTCLGIASYYLYIESWCMAYTAYSLLGGFGIEDPSAFFARLTGDRPDSILAFSIPGLVTFAVCIGINIFILSRGLAGGIEVVAKVGMPLLILFGAVLAVKGLMSTPEADPNVVESPLVGLNYVWEPKLDRLGSPSTWLAAAGQIFFTLSIGMGSIHCYASYLRRNDDVALTGATTAWTNEFCEVILGGSILIPIGVAYLGLAGFQGQMATSSGLGMAFVVVPPLFNNWGQFAPVAGFFWFGLLFIAAITSSLAMGQPIMAFLEDEFGFNRIKSSWTLGAMICALALPVAMLHSNGPFSDFDYWVGTFALVVFAMLETVLFAWAFGIDRGWDEMMRGADMKVPRLFYYIMKYVTPTFLMIILAAYAFEPAGAFQGKDRGWEGYILAMRAGEPMPSWEWSGNGMIGKLLHKDLAPPADASAETRTFFDRLKLVRTIDRLVLVGIFIGFAVLVNRAWARKRREGRAAS